MIKSSSKYLYTLAVLLPVLVLMSCGNSKKENQADTLSEETGLITYAPMEPLLELEQEVRAKITDWDAFWELEKEMNNFRSTESGDLGFITDELIRIQQKLMIDSLPGNVDIPAVKSRVLVFSTFAGKLKDQLNHRVPVAEIDTTRMKILESYNAFRYQVSDALREKVYEDFLERDSLETGASGLPRN